MRWRCTECGVLTGTSAHRCNENMLVAHQVRLFEPMFKHFLSTNDGRFAVYYAQRRIARDSTAA